MTIRNKETKETTGFCHNCNEEVTIQIEEGEVLVYSIDDKKFWSHYTLRCCKACSQCLHQTNTDCYIE